MNSGQDPTCGQGVVSVRRVAVYCGARTGNSPRFAQVARELGDTLARHGIGVVYGGASRGLMGVLADAALAAGGEVIGVLPGSLSHREIAHDNLSDLHLVGTMHERKALIADLADAFAVLPGGIGTLDEFFEAFTWAQIGIHSKPIALMNVDGFYEPLLAHLRNTVAAGFLSSERLDSLQVCPDVDSFISSLSTRATSPAAPPLYEALSVKP
jgi:uncharacterized protein (TIGR00730 family)